MQNLERLIRLFHHRWAIPVLAELHRCGGGSRVAELAHVLAVNRPSLRRTLAALRAQELVRPNPGHGHPLRPEWLLTARGARLAPHGFKLLAAASRHGFRKACLTKWPMPIARCLLEGPVRFGELRRQLEVVTPRALSIALDRLCQRDLVSRRILDESPPGTLYALRRHARRLVAPLRAM